MKIALVTLSAGEEFERMAALVNPPKARFCDRWGYDFIAFHELLDADRPAPWSKIRAVARVLPRYDWIVWCDADTVLFDRDNGLRRFITAAGNADFVIQRNWDGINTGVFFVRNTPWSIRFLDMVYEQTEFIDHPWWEQAAISALAERPEIAAHFQIYAPREPVAGFHGYYEKGDWGATFLHLAGIKGEERLYLIENLARLSAFSPRRRLLSRGSLGALLNRCDLLGEGVEVGVSAGHFSKAILDVWEGRRLHLVDAWRHLADYRDIANLSDDEHQRNFEGLPDVLAAHQGRYRAHRLLSEEAAALFDDGSLDFVYLDADHSQTAMTRDLHLWYKKLRRGGLFAGHDFVDGSLSEGEFGVRAAVVEFERSKGVRAAVTAERQWPSWY
ncbi:MAG TPA: class I SAM-dependent methyltransferase, partial [Pirellulales bacterium]